MLLTYREDVHGQLSTDSCPLLRAAVTEQYMRYFVNILILDRFQMATLRRIGSSGFW